MSVHNPAESSRKSSESSTHPSGRSPTISPNKRKPVTGTAGNMFGVAMGGSTSLKGLNSGWQVWGSGRPTSRRNPSVSSATSVTDLSPPPSDAAYRSNLGEGWTKPASGTWDDSGESPQKKEFSQLEPLILHQTRQWQATSGHAPTYPVPRVDDRPSGSKVGQFSPQRYDNGLAKDTGARYSSASPTKPATFGGGSYAGQSSGLPANPGGYEPLQTSSIVENDVSLALRGMAVEDEYSATRQQMSNRGLVLQTSPSTTVQHPRALYNTYPQTDFAPYYSNVPGREPYVDYQYGYEIYHGPSDSSLYTSSGGLTSANSANLYHSISPQAHHLSPVDVHRQQPGLIYDYGVSVPPQTPQFYYPNHQTVMYPHSHSPMVTPQLAPAHHIMHGDKKHDLPYNMPHQLVPQNLMYSPLLRSSPPPHSPGYASGFDYGSRLPLIIPGAPIYGMNLQAMHMYQQSLRTTRHDGFDSSMVLRSTVLDEFRTNKTRKWDLRDIFGYVVEFSGDQHGSRFIQQKLETATSEEKQRVFDEIVPDSALQLIQDVFGNYVVQKLFEHGTQVQKTILAHTMEGHVLSLSLQMYGCRVVQKAVEYILPDQQSAFVKELEHHVLKCVKDANGNHVIQKLIERVSPDRLGFVTSFRNNVYDLSTHPYGCRVLQRCLEHLPEEYTRPLLEELHKYTANLMQDQFGNYVIQFILEHGKPQDRALAISKLCGQMLQMARHKFASNVCEKALVTADPDNRRILINEILTPKPDGMSPIVTMMKDQFANYVLQRALTVVDAEQKEALVAVIRPQLVSMRKYSNAYNKHLSSIERLIEKCPPSSGGEEYELPSHAVAI